jgi:D-beta-D-heptose 7-phosphate kinase/D-beta-D-heptose 1-phosphate adenosyltransferase
LTGQILVVGETCLDIFVYCHALRLAPDIPVPVLQISKTSENPGMAMNVQRNIAKLVPDCQLVTNPEWRTVTKTRYMHENTNHMFVRVDTSHEIPRVDVKSINLDYEIIVISDYNKGFLTEEDIQFICDIHPKVFLDTKKRLGEWANKAKYIKINDYEFRRSLPYLNPILEERIIHTTGAGGCVFKGKNYPVEKVEVVDTSGAGDTFISALAVKYLETSDIDQSIKFANLCASDVVKRRGVSTL